MPPPLPSRPLISFSRTRGVKPSRYETTSVSARPCTSYRTRSIKRWFTPPEESTHRAGVAYVGRIEPHKNQLGLIRELRGTGIAVVLAGPSHPHHAKYAERCRKEADAFVTFSSRRRRAGSARGLSRAAVHVLPSWFETTGLVSLEAAATGCAVVTTNRGYVKEYFGDLVFYCDPGPSRIDQERGRGGAGRRPFAGSAEDGDRELHLGACRSCHPGRIRARTRVVARSTERMCASS